MYAVLLDRYPLLLECALADGQRRTNVPVRMSPSPQSSLLTLSSALSRELATRERV